MPEGKTFTEDIGNELEKSDLIKLNKKWGQLYFSFS